MESELGPLGAAQGHGMTSGKVTGKEVHCRMEKLCFRPGKTWEKGEILWGRQVGSLEEI